MNYHSISYDIQFGAPWEKRHHTDSVDLVEKLHDQKAADLFHCKTRHKKIMFRWLKKTVTCFITEIWKKKKTIGNFL